MPKSSAYPGLKRDSKKNSNWVEAAGGLPSYIERIAKHLHYEGGHSISTAIAMAVSTVKRWAAGGDDTKPATKAKAAKAVAQWEALKGKAKKNKALKEARSYPLLKATPAELEDAAQSFAERLTVVEGLLLSLEEGARMGAVRSALNLLEGYDSSLVIDPRPAPAREAAAARERLVKEAELLAELVEAVRGTKPAAPKPPAPKAAPAEPEAKKPLPHDPDETRTGHLQARLSSLGHGIKVDGHYGPKTHAEILTFQAKNGLKVDGEVGPLTTEALRLGGNGGAPAAGADPTAPGAETKRAPSALANESDDRTIFKGLGVGERSGHSGVKEVQVALGELGYELEPDGRFGPETEKAVKRMQRKYGLKPDGIVGDKTHRTITGVARKKKQMETAEDDLAEATDGREIVALRARIRQLRSEIESPGSIEEAKTFKRGSSSARVVELKRLPNGEFAPKGLGQVLKAGMKVEVPHKSKPGEMVTGTVVDAGKFAADIRLDSGPDQGKPWTAHATSDAKAAGASSGGAPPEPKPGTPEFKAAQQRNAKAKEERYGKKPKPPQSPGTDDGKGEKKQKTAWAAFDKKQAEFEEAKKGGDKKVISQKASQLRAARWAIKRAGGDPANRPAFAQQPFKDSDTKAPSQSKTEKPKEAIDASKIIGDGSDPFGNNPKSANGKKKAAEKAKAATPSGAGVDKAPPTKAKIAGHNLTFDGSANEDGSWNATEDETGDKYIVKSIPQGKFSAKKVDAKPSVESYDTKKGPSAEQKAANAEKMGKKPKATKPPAKPAATPDDLESALSKSVEQAKAKKAGAAAQPTKVPSPSAAEVAKANLAGKTGYEPEQAEQFPDPPSVDELVTAIEKAYGNDPLPDDLMQVLEDLDIAIDGDDGDAMDTFTDNLMQAVAQRDGDPEGSDIGKLKPDAAESVGATPTPTAPASPQQAALDAYKAAGGDDPNIIAVLSAQASGAPAEEATPAAPPAAAAPAAPAPAKTAAPAAQGGGLQQNTTGIDLASMTQGQVFQDAKGQTWTYHKPTAGGEFHIVKGPDGKGKPFHGKMQPPLVGPAPAGGAPASPADAPTPEDPDALFNQLSKSVEQAKAKKGAPASEPHPSVAKAAGESTLDHEKNMETASEPALGYPGTNPKIKDYVANPALFDSPGRGPTGKMRNFKAMNVAKLSNVVYELENFGEDPEALAAAKAALAAKT